MFRGKINRSNSRQLLNVLERLQNGERDVLSVNILFNSVAVLPEPCIKPKKSVAKDLCVVHSM
jgi:hypothetical protein